jgi:hypothetical protein
VILADPAHTIAYEVLHHRGLAPLHNDRLALRSVRENGAAELEMPMARARARKISPAEKLRAASLRDSLRVRVVVPVH